MRPPVKDKQSIDNDSVNDKNQALSTVVSKIQNDGNTQRKSVEKTLNQYLKISVRYGGVTEDTYNIYSHNSFHSRLHFTLTFNTL